MGAKGTRGPISISALYVAAPAVGCPATVLLLLTALWESPETLLTLYHLWGELCSRRGRGTQSANPPMERHQYFYHGFLTTGGAEPYEETFKL